MQQPSFFAPVLDAVLSPSGADGAYIYRFDEGGSSAQLSAWSGVTPKTEPRVIQGRIVQEHYERESPLMVHEGAWIDRRFAALPEFEAQPFEGVVSLPLIHSGERLGLLNLCRFTSAAIPVAELGFLLRLALSMAALLSAGSKIDRLEHQLADRKLFDRAKGVLQATLGWTEEEAYLHLRRTSRQRRTPMRDVAREVIERNNLRLLGARQAS